MLTPKNARSRSVTKLCLALETFRRTDEGRVRDAKSFLGFWLPYEAGKDRLFVHIPNEVRADLLSNWGVRGKKSALRDDDEKVRTTLADALGAGDIDAAVIESGVTPEILVDWAPLDEWWSFWRGSALPTGAIRKALATARELDMFDEKWFFQNLALKSQKLEGTDVVSAALSKEQVTAWLLAVHASEDASPAGLVRAIGWETVLARTAHEALLHVLDALASTVGLVARHAETTAAAPAPAPAAASVPPPVSPFPSDPPISSDAMTPRAASLPVTEPAQLTDPPAPPAPKTEPAPPLKVEPPPAKPVTATAPKSEPKLAPKADRAPPSAKPVAAAPKAPPAPARKPAADATPSSQARPQPGPPKSVPPRPAPPVPAKPATKPADSAPPSTRPSARALFGAPAASPGGPGPVRPKALTLAGVGGELPMFGDPLDPPELEPPSTPTLAEPAAVDALELVPVSPDEPAWAPPRAEPGDMGWDLIHGVQRPLTTNVQPKYNFDDDDEPTSEIALPGDPHRR